MADAASEPAAKPGLSNLAQRLLTAAVLIPILVVSMFVETTAWSILACSVLAVFFAADEYLRMGLGDQGRTDSALGLRAVFGLAGAGVMVGNFVLGTQAAMAPTMFLAAMGVATAVLVRKQHLADAGRHLAYALAGLVYVPMLACVWPLLKKELGP
jgi:phosphatidate cytidylyltransferase